jgi:cytosine/adenosine deaminase-related metal-dependent hydrolase
MQRTPRYKGDVGIRDGKVVTITGAGGPKAKTCKQEIDAEGLIVAPGFVDLHTYYDAQVFWDPYCTTGGARRNVGCDRELWRWARAGQGRGLAAAPPGR